MKERLLVETQAATIVPPQKEQITVVRSGLPKRVVNNMYTKLKNEGKCCEGGSEGWMG